MLTSPGVQVSVIDESFYTPAAAGTVPLLFVATAENKINGSQTGIADGTLKSNAGKPFLITSQRELVERFGEPLFYSDANGNMIHGSELNEYGLQTAYSVLGVSNRAFVVRANVDLASLKPSATAPGGQPVAGSYWLNGSATSFGALEWNGSAAVASGGQSFTSITPIVITSITDTTGSEPYAPSNAVGTTDDYAIVAVSDVIKLWYRNRNGVWVQVGSGEWRASWPTVTATRVAANLTNGQTLLIDGETVTIDGTTMSALAASINDAEISGVTAIASGSTIQIFTSNTQLAISAGTGTLMADAGLAAKTYYAPTVAIDPHTMVPKFKTTDAEPRPTGSVWLKTTEPNGGIKIRLNRYNADTQLWEAISVPAYKNNHEAIFNLDKSGGTRLLAGDVYAKLNVEETDEKFVSYTLYRRAAGGETVAISEKISNQLVGVTAGSFDIQESRAGSVALSSAVTISVADLEGNANDAQLIAAAINANAALQNVVASVNAANRLIIKHKLGGDFRIADTDGIMSLIGIDETVDNVYTTPTGDSNNDYLVSLWSPLSYEVSNVAPLSLTADGEIWYNSVVDEVDIMVKQGDSWVGYQNAYEFTNNAGPFVSASEPTGEIADGDLWVDTADLENYPTIYRYNSALSRWILVDKTDQTTENGIIFADARWSTNGQASQPASIEELLVSNYVDPDAPDPALYPEGMLLWNLRRSGFNVKRFVRNYINTSALNTRFENQTTENYYPHRWVTVSGNNEDGSGTFGRHAQRKAVVQALQASIVSGQEIRDEEARQFNLIACPGYPELIGEMITLNFDRRLTAFVVGDSPMRLKPDATSLNEWATNVNRVTEDGENGLVSFDEYLGIYYGAGFTTSNAGQNIVMPASYMALRTLIINDQIAYPWFAPAGTRRGAVTNASATGYINDEGEFVSIALNTGQRDTLYANNINPITFLNGSGLVVFGQKTRARSATALDRVNVARLIVYMRRQLELLTRSYLFEPNDQGTRDQVKSAVEKFCLELLSLRGIYDYLVVCDESNNTPARVDRNELYVDIAIEPTKAVEFIYIPLRLKNTGEIGNL